MRDPARTPTETLMAALAECETAESAVIILRHGEAISWHQTTYSRADLLGVLEFVLCCAIHKENPMATLISMETTAQEAKEYTQPSVADAPKYPWGLNICLSDDSLDKLGVKTLPAVGTEVTIVAKAIVASTSENATEGSGTRSSMDLQITDMQLDGLNADLFGRAAEMLYGKAK